MNNEQNKMKGSDTGDPKISPRDAAAIGYAKMDLLCKRLVEKDKGASIHISRKELREMIADVQWSLTIHMRAFVTSEAANSTSGEKATDGADGAKDTTNSLSTRIESSIDPSTLPFDDDTLDYKNWNATEMMTVLDQLKLDIGKASKITKEFWDERVRQAKAALPAHMSLNPCVVTTGIMMSILNEQEYQWADPHHQIPKEIWIKVAAIYEDDDKISLGVLGAMPVFRIDLLRRKLNNDVLARTCYWPRDVRRRAVRETLRDIVTVMFSREDVDTDTVDSISPADIWLATRWADEAKRTNRDICEVAREFNEKVPGDLKWDVDIVFGYTDKLRGGSAEPFLPDPKRVKTVAAADETIVGSEQPEETNTLIGFITTKAAPTDSVATEDPIGGFSDEMTTEGSGDQIDSGSLKGWRYNINMWPRRDNE